MPSELIAAMALIKRACALAQGDLVKSEHDAPSFDDEIPAGLHVAASVGIAHNLLPSLAALRIELLSQAKFYQRHGQSIHAGKISSHVTQLAQVCDDLVAALPLAHRLPLLCGHQGMTRAHDFAQQVAQLLTKLLNLDFVPSLASTKTNETLRHLHGHLKSVALCLMNMARDMSALRPLSNNTTQCDALTMVCCQVISNDSALTISAAQFETAALQPLIAHKLLESMRLLSDAATLFNEYFLRGMPTNGDLVSIGMANSLMLATAPVPQVA